MSNEPDSAGGGTREWDAERLGDGLLRLRVPAAKWDYFARRFRPVADVSAAVVWDALFAGVGRPFHYKAVGWQGKLRRRMRPRPVGVHDRVAEELAERLGWSGDATAYLVFPSRDVCEAQWADLLDGFRRGWVAVDEHWGSMVLCSEASEDVAEFLEGNGPYFARRQPVPLRTPRLA